MPTTAAANQQIIEAIDRANGEDSDAQHMYDDGPALGWQLAAADVAITDISAMVYDRLATGKPVIITRPVSPNAEVDMTGYLGAAEWLDSFDAPNIVEIIDRVQHDEDAQRRLEYWVTRHFGDTSPGAATARFHRAVERLVDEWHTHAALHASDPRVRDADPFELDDDEEDDPAPTAD